MTLNEIIEQFPSFFNEKTHWNYHCPDGWLSLLFEVCKEVVSHDGNENFKFMQIKDKFGELRIYTNGNKKINDFIDKITEKSRGICMKCGNQNTSLQMPGFLVLCEKCSQGIAIE